MSPDVAEANLILGQTKFALSLDEQLKAWTIYKVLAETEQGFLSPMILPSLQVIDQAGNEILTDLEWKNIVPSKIPVTNASTRVSFSFIIVLLFLPHCLVFL